MFPNDPPRIVFTKDFRLLVHGDLGPGRTVTIIYDAERLAGQPPDEESSEDWTIKVFYKFQEEGQVHETELWSETGTILSKLTDEPGEGTMLQCSIDLPADADHLTIWFLKIDQSGAEHWDSNLGRNYTFRFVVEDLHVDSVGVAGGPESPVAEFHIAVSALPEVEDLAVLYSIMNNQSKGREERRMPLVRSDSLDPGGKGKWSGSTAVPEKAVVRFTFSYNAYGNPHADTNSGKGYLTWTGAHTSAEAGVLAK
jgi:hypothetical protein